MTRSVEIPEEAVEAAVEAFWSRRRGPHPMREALQAALPYLAREVVVDHRPGETCSVIANVDPETGFARVPAGDGGLREALAAKPFCSHTHRRLGCPYCDCNEDLQRIVAAHPAAPAVPQPVDREALVELATYFRAQSEGCEQLRSANEESGADLTAIDYAARASTWASAAHYLDLVLAGEQEQVAPE